MMADFLRRNQVSPAPRPSSTPPHNHMKQRAGPFSQAPVTLSHEQQDDSEFVGGESGIPAQTEVLYIREVPFDIRDSAEKNTKTETLTVRIVVLGPDKDPEAYRVEITSEEDLFFHYSLLVNVFNFKSMQSRQNLTVDFHNFVNILVDILDNCVEESEQYNPVFMFKPDGQAKLVFFQNLGYKFVELLSLDFKASGDAVVRAHVQHRYQGLKIEYQSTKSRLLEILNVVKSKNPSLLLYLQQRPASPTKPKSRRLSNRT